MEEETGKIQRLYETYMNGNISEARKKVKKLTKLELLDLLELWTEYESRHLVINKLRSLLNK